MSHDSGKVGDQAAGRGSQVGREAEHTVQDNVDAGEGRKYDLSHTGVIENTDAKGNHDRVDQDRPLNGAAPITGSLEKHSDSHEPGPDISSVQGVQTGGYAAQDTEVEEPVLSTRTAQATNNTDAGQP